MENIRAASLITAIKTPYLLDGEIDIEAYDSLVEFQIQHGVDGIIVGGTTGEGHLMDWEEHLMLISHSVHKFGHKLLIIGNTGSNNTYEAIKATHFGFASGMHASLQINPYYGKTSRAGLLTHFQKVLDLGPAIVYNVPGRTGQDLVPEVMLKLAEHANFAGIKECTGSDRIKSYEDRGIACWSGNDDDSFTSRYESRSHGVISVTSNLVPGLMKRLMKEKDEALKIRLMPLISWLFSEPNPIPLNTAMSMLGCAKPVIRLPYVPLDRTMRQKGVEILQSFQGELPGTTINVMEDEAFILL
ncbi:MAG: 4-hydroxy-tetrahydrodipicolinate synthase [SAR324 cluster bacterium]|nr:4-hydroxy-tetrahydrodipicolinate synthase [SAR324 cluster bacterium]